MPMPRMTSPDIKAEREPKEEHSSPDSQKPAVRRRSKAVGTRRRTKTGCLTCRQRRVKCDEMKPTCRNCEKSRRQCAGYQPLTVPPPPFESPPCYMPLSEQQQMQMQMEYFPLPPDSTITPTTGAAHELQTQHFGHMNPHQTGSHSYMWPIADGSFGNRHTHLSPSEWVHAPIPDSQFPFHDMHHAMTAESSYRNEGLQTASATSSRPSLASTSDSAAHLRTRTQHTRPVLLQAYSTDDFEDPEDPWDVDSDDDDDNVVENHDAVVPFGAPQSLVLNERMAYLLKHFVTVVRPCISIYERPLAFDGTSTLAEKLPTLALSCRPLMHGLMAVSALHLAVLHQTNEVVPLKHFVIASKKLAKLISNPASRHQVETLGLCLVLAFYEVLLGDHARWILHLRGAAAFLLEHDYAGFARLSRRMRRQAQLNLSHVGPQHDQISQLQYTQMAGIPSALLSDDEWQVDESLVSRLTGLEIDYSHQHQPSVRTAIGEKDLTQSDVYEWRTKLDLLYWYLKMDIFQSILSGDPLLLRYENWKYFPPRGKIGMIGSVHATMDHLWLVLGRIADFGAKDRARKLQKLTTTGGAWKPEPGFLKDAGPPAKSRPSVHRADMSNSTTQADQPPSANEGRTRMPKATVNVSASKKAPPLFFGMMPPPSIPPSMLSSFHVTDTALRDDSDSNEPVGTSMQIDVEVATRQALTEHIAMTEALDLWERALGEDFGPLPIRTTTPGTIFTPTRRYQDPTVASIWALYHLGRILLRRYHPHSPPAMMVSASVNAPYTSEDANEIGRIVAGLLEGQAELARAGSINPTLVAALQELTFPLMFAGVQYRDPAQRSWLIDMLLDLAKDGGWRTAHSVAAGLESSWLAQGGGYKPTLARRSPDAAHKYDKRQFTGKIGSTPAAEHESRFVNHDRRLIDQFSDLRAFWAMGLLSSQDDLTGMMGRINLNRGG